jgi:hypothetical protein
MIGRRDAIDPAEGVRLVAEFAAGLWTHSLVLLVGSGRLLKSCAHILTE